jgi:transcriptional regulator with XRE-family HTH domain
LTAFRAAHKVVAAKEMTMTLKDWLKGSGKRLNEVAEELGVARQTLARWRDGAVPRKSRMDALVAYTGGAVQPNDFYVSE